MALKRVWIASPNHSARRGQVRACIVHTAEGARSYRDLGSFFANSDNQVSSHTGIDDEKGVIGEYVSRADSAWTQAAYNSLAISTELCAAPIDSPYPCGARWSTAEWNRHPNMLQNLADWIREECQHFGLPIQKLSAAQAQAGGRGVCGHVDLGSAGGGHYDPGPNFPWGRVMAMARQDQPATPKPPPHPAAQTLASVRHHDGRLHTFEYANDGTVQHKWQTQENDGWVERWESLGKP